MLKLILLVAIYLVVMFGLQYYRWRSKEKGTQSSSKEAKNNTQGNRICICGIEHIMQDTGQIIQDSKNRTHKNTEESIQKRLSKLVDLDREQAEQVIDYFLRESDKGMHGLSRDDAIAAVGIIIDAEIFGNKRGKEDYEEYADYLIQLARHDWQNDHNVLKFHFTIHKLCFMCGIMAGNDVISSQECDEMTDRYLQMLKEVCCEAEKRPIQQKA